jgi:O-antigen ligase
MACVVGALLGTWGILVAVGRQDAALGLQGIWFIVLPFLAAVIWTFVQASSLTPTSWHHPLWETAGKAMEIDIAGAISLNPYLTLSHLARLLAYGGIFWLAIQYCRKPGRARDVLAALTYAGFAFAVYGLIAYAFDARTMFGFEKPAYEGDLTSTFVNRNTYATYAGLVLICATSLIIVVITQRANAVLSQMTREVFTDIEKAQAAHMGKPTLFTEDAIERLVRSLTRGDWFLFVAWGAVLTSLIFTHSRAGFISTVVALIALIVVLALTRTPHRGYAAGAAGACLLGVALVFLIGGKDLEERLLTLSVASEERPRVYDLTLSAIEDAPMLGTGYGTFEEVFRFYRTGDIQGYYTMAHSTYLENVLELGLPAAIALFLVFGGFLYLTLRGIRRRRRDAVYPCVGFAATLLVAVHSLVDFSLQIPAVAATYALIMGATCAQCWSTRRPEDAW